jgi:hypothetical protein
LHLQPQKKSFTQIVSSTACCVKMSSDLRRVCPKYPADECSEKAPAFYLKSSTFAAHYCAEHLPLAKVDYILEKTIDDYEGETECTVCPTKNKFKNRPQFLAHQCHRHYDAETLKWIINSFIVTTKKNTPMSSKSELAAVEAEIRCKNPLPKKLRSVNSNNNNKATADDDDDDEMEDGNEDGYQSTGTNSSVKSASASAPYVRNAMANPLLKNKRIMEKLNEAFTNFSVSFNSEQEFKGTMVAQTYFEANPDASAVAYIDYLKERKQTLSIGANGENLDIPSFK